MAERKRAGFLIVYTLMLLSGWLGSCRQSEIKYINGAVPPAEAAATYETEPGFKIELIASEPLVADPVDMEIDEFGRLYVVEMHGYPLDKSGNGAIKLLSDENGDGIMDKSTVFADKLVLPNGILRWKKGVLVTDAPYVLYFEDTDGNGVADIRDTVLTGFSLSNPHINVNNPVYGLDNWIHLAHRGALTTRAYKHLFDDEGEEVYFYHKPESPRLPKNADSRSVRFKPDSYEIELTATKAQFGHTFDTWGRHLFGDNQNHAYAEALAAHYSARNPLLLATQTTEAISDHGNAAPIYQITTHPERQMFSGAGTMTSASGIVAYTGGAFPAPFDKNINFICESVSNLVHADQLRDTGSTFIASRVGRTGKEFLASTDAWARPVNLYIGPDGALYVVDYYRRIIEHPEWMSEEAVQAGGLYDGMNMGRIYRVSATDTPAPHWTKGLDLGNASSETLVAALNHVNSWWRINAQRLLVDRGDQTIVPALENLFDTALLAEARLHALWTLEGLKALQPVMIAKALKDPEAGIRENAVRLAELHLQKHPILIPALLALQNDPAPKVRFQLLCTLGEVDGADTRKASEHILFRDISDKWVRIAALTARHIYPQQLIATTLQKYKAGIPAYDQLLQQLAAMAVAGNGMKPDSLVRSVVKGPQQPWQAPLLEGIAEGLRYKKKEELLSKETEVMVLKSCFEHPADKVRKAAYSLLKVTGVSDVDLLTKAMHRAEEHINNKQLPDEKRVDAINILSLGNPAPHTDLLKKLITPQEHPTVQLAALKTLSLVPDDIISTHLAENWALVTPAIQEEAIKLLMNSGTRRKLLMDALVAGKIPGSSISWLNIDRLMQDGNDTIRNAARKFFVVKDQDKIIKDFQKALDLRGDINNGKLVFEKNCSICHQVRGENGTAFGPDLGTVQGWLAKDIMANVLEPGLSIAVGFDTREIELNNGEVIQGIIANETAAAITVKSAPGVERTINRQDIKSLKMLNISLMPPFSQQLDHQQMADLIAHLQHMN